jgi:hypothetical protein
VGLRGDDSPLATLPSEMDAKSSSMMRPDELARCKGNCGGCSASNRAMPPPEFPPAATTFLARHALMPNLTESTKSLHAASSNRVNARVAPENALMWATVPADQHDSLRDDTRVSGLRPVAKQTRRAVRQVVEGER